ncbi:hypothetical protein ACLOJK_034117 [Asimina triloba]
MAAAAAALLPFFASVTIFFSFMISMNENNVGFVQAKGGFSVDLIHRDSRGSPHYNPSETSYDRLSKAVLRSNSRATFFSDSLKKRTSSSVSPDDVRSTIHPNGGNYLMELAFGTPPVKTLAIADTGSDLIWIQCQPCDGCFQQDVPLFDPKASSSYRDLSCTSQPCSSLPEASCNQSQCRYSYSYGDQSFTNGVLAAETLTFDSTSSGGGGGGSTVKVPKVAFGCGHNNGGTFDRHESGLVGLGGGSLSLVSQLGSSIEGKFAYCLAPAFASSSPASTPLNFGDSATVSGSDVITLPLVSKDPDTFFFVTLESIVVGGKKVELPGAENGGNIILDSGTTLTYLDNSAFSPLLSAVRDAIDLTPIQDPSGSFDLCYDASSNSSQEAKFPDITFRFTGGDLVLPPSNTFVEVSQGVICLTMAGSDSFSIFGNIGQTNFKVGYDLVGKKVRFLPTDCSKN